MMRRRGSIDANDRSAAVAAGSELPRRRQDSHPLHDEADRLHYIDTRANAEAGRAESHDLGPVPENRTT